MNRKDAKRRLAKNGKEIKNFEIVVKSIFCLERLIFFLNVSFYQSSWISRRRIRNYFLIIEIDVTDPIEEDCILINRGLRKFEISGEIIENLESRSIDDKIRIRIVKIKDRIIEDFYH